MGVKNLLLESDFPEHNLSGRGKLVYKWLPERNGVLLDAGCSYGYATRFYSQKADETYGIDANEKQIKIAASRYTNINFLHANLEKLPFGDAFFDTVVISDVLEHVSDEIQVLSEVYRVLKPGAVLIITVPHKGMFEFLDPYNYGYFLKKKAPNIYRFLYKTIAKMKGKKDFGDSNPLHDIKHYHYNERDLRSMLSNSEFSGSFEILEILKSGLLIEPVTLNIESVLKIFLNDKAISFLLKPMRFLSSMDYGISYDGASYNLAMKIKKVN